MEYMDISNVQGVRADISEMISKIREVSTKSKIFSEDTSIKPAENFESVLSMAKKSLSSVNQLSAEADKIQNSYITGDGSVSISQVIVASQKSKLAFEGLLAVRNKILDAYKEVMQMSV